MIRRSPLTPIFVGATTIGLCRLASAQDAAAGAGIPHLLQHLPFLAGRNRLFTDETLMPAALLRCGWRPGLAALSVLGCLRPAAPAPIAPSVWTFRLDDHPVRLLGAGADANRATLARREV